jgi:hypothetical protein
VLQSAKGWFSLVAIGFNTNYPGLVTNYTTRSDCAWDGVPCSDANGYSIVMDDFQPFAGNNIVQFENTSFPIETVFAPAQYTPAGVQKAPPQYTQPWGNCSSAGCAAAASVNGTASFAADYFASAFDRARFELWVPQLKRHVTMLLTASAAGRKTYTIDPATIAASPFNLEAYNTRTNGTFNVTDLHRGINASVSKPHFLGADPRLRAALQGMSPPNSTRHDTFITLDQATYAPAVPAHQRLQLNVALAPLVVDAGLPSNYTWFANVSRAVLPIMWVDAEGPPPPTPPPPTPPPPTPPPPTPPPPTPPPPPPPTPTPMYDCVASQCVASATGHLNLSECRSMCVPQQLYHCLQGVCTPADSGVSKEKCTAACFKSTNTGWLQWLLSPMPPSVE